MKGMNPGKMSKTIAGRPVTPKSVPNKGQVRQSSQSGSTSPRTDGGGGLGNSSSDLHKRIVGKC